MKYLDNAYIFYAEYHNDMINKLIHILCVWPIFFTGLVFLSYTKPIAIAQSIAVNWSVIISFIYGSFYFIIEQPGIAGPIATLLVTFCYFGSKELVSLYPDIWKIALVIHISGWFAQFYGHGIHEKRSPALKDNLFQALLIAPLFIVLEVLALVGYKKEFFKSIEPSVQAKIKKFRDSIKKKGK